MSSFISFVLAVVYSCTGFRGEKHRKYTRKINEKESLLCQTLECPICLENLLSDQKLITMKCDCRYFYHQNCLESWFSSRKHLNTMFCPTCQNEF
jgi:hypothetical protein